MCAFNSRGPGFLAPVMSRSFCSLDTSVGVSGPHDFAVRTTPFVRTKIRARRFRVHRILSRVRDDSRSAPLAGPGCADDKHTLPKNGSEIFFARGLDRNSASPLVGQISRANALRFRRFHRRHQVSFKRLSQDDLLAVVLFFSPGQIRQATRRWKTQSLVAHLASSKERQSRAPGQRRSFSGCDWSFDAFDDDHARGTAGVSYAFQLLVGRAIIKQLICCN